jgi:hypothetical protein
MARIRYRYLLPLGHLLVDLIVLSHFIWQGHLWQRDRCRQSPVVRNVAFAQEGAVPWSPVYVCFAHSPDFDFLVTGTLPAGLISFAVRPEARWHNCARLWDPLWFSIHESIALLFWFLLGGWLDSPGAPLRKLLGGYLLLRFALIPLCWLPAWSEAGAPLQMLFWLMFLICALVRGSLWLLRRLRARP